MTQGHESRARSLNIQEQLHQSLTGELVERCPSLHQAHTRKMQEMFGPANYNYTTLETRTYTKRVARKYRK